MSRRTQITLTDAQYERLRSQSQRTGASLAELVRRAVASVYGPAEDDGSEQALEDSFGAWAQRDFDSARYAERLRRGMAERLSG